MLRKVFLVLGLLFVFAIAALGIFVATFDADRYRPLLVEEMQRAIGRPISLERVSLGFRQGIALQLSGFAIYEDAQRLGEPLLRVESAAAVIRLPPLLKKRVEIVSVALRRPAVHAARDAQGRVNLTGLAAAASPAAAAVPPKPGGTAPVSFSIAALTLSEGTLHWTDALRSPPTELWVNAVDVEVRNIAPGRPMDLDLQAAIAGQARNIRLKGRFTPPASGVPGAIEQATLGIDALPLEAVLPPPQPGAPALRGLLSASLEGSLPTLDPAQLQGAITGQGRVTLTDGVIVNLNVLRAVFDRLSMLPGLVQALEARLPPEYQQKLAARDTALAPLELPLRLERGRLLLQRLQARTDTFALHGEGELGLDGAVNLRGVLRIEPALSAAIVRSVNELQALANARQELEIPLSIQGQAPQVAVLPDVQYVASKVLVNKAVDFLGNLLRQPEEDAPPGAEAPADQPPPGASQEDPLAAFLRRAIEQHTSGQEQ